MTVHFSSPGWERRGFSISHAEFPKDLSLVILSRADSYSVIVDMSPDVFFFLYPLFILDMYMY